MTGSGIEASAVEGSRDGWRVDVGAGLVGRVDDALGLRRLLLSHALVTVVGPGGVGKTRLAVHVAPPSDHVTWVHLATVQRSDELEHAVAAAFHLRTSGDALVRALAGRFAEAGHVLVLDNAEHLVAAVAELAHALVATCPAAQILCTSRELLRVPGEVTFSVAPLDDDAAAELFVGRSREAGGDPGGDVAAIVELCRRLDCLPLAIELAASRTRALTIAQIAADLRQRLDLLGEGRRVGPPHQRTLESSIEWSVALLEPVDRAVLRDLSVFGGPFTAAAAEAVVAGDDGVAHREVLPTLVRLTDRSLLQPVRDDVGEPRFVLLESVRDHGRRQLEHDAVDAAGVRNRLVAWAREKAATTAPLLAGAEAVATLDELTRERPNILAALAIAREGDPASLVALHVDLHLFWRHRGGTASAARDLRTALTSVTDPSLRQRGWCTLAALEAMANQPAEARRAAAEALVLADGEGDREGRALALNYLGWASILDDDLAGAGCTLEEALVEAESRPLTWCASDIIAGLGYVTHRAGRPAAAYQLFERALEVATATGNQWMAVQARYFLAATALADGRLALARREATMGAELARSLDDDAYLACHLSFLGVTCARAGDLDAAEQLADEADVRAARSGWTPWAERYALHAAATLAAARGDVSALLRVWEHARAHEGPTARDAARACLALHEGDSARAERIALDALRGTDLASNPGPVIDTLEVLACTAERRGARERAAELRAAVIAARVPERYGRLAAEDAAFGPPQQEAAPSGTRPLQVVVAGVLHGRRRRGDVTAGWASLTATERHVVDLLLGGRSNARIAADMRISVPTVKSHLTHIYSKLDVGSRLELAQHAASDPPPWNPPTFG